MLTTFLEKVGGFLDRHYIIAYWMPVFVGAGLLAAVVAFHLGIAELITRWTSAGAVTQALIAVSILLVITVVAYLLQALTTSMVRFYEGYTWPTPFAKWSRSQQQRIFDRLTSTLNEEDSDTRTRYRYLHFPLDRDRVRPTKLGNTLTAAEEHAYNLVKIDSVLWWPRLVAVLPESFRAQIDDALTPMIGLLNLCTFLIVVAFIGGGYLFWYDQRWWLFGLMFGGGLVLARLCYSAAVSQAVAYGNLVRTAFDLYRHEILKQMGIFVPKNLDDEIKLWTVLNTWIFDQYTPPDFWYDETQSPSWLKPPFHYQGLSDTAAGNEEIAVKGELKVTHKVGGSSD